MKHIIHGKSDGVNFIPEARYRWREALRMFEGKKVTIRMERFSKKRSMPQNRYYWGVIVELIYRQLVSDGWEVSKEDVHEMLKVKFAIKEIFNEATGEVMQSIRSTTEMSTTEFDSYNETCKKWAAETLDLYIPDPNEYEFEI